MVGVITTVITKKMMDPNLRTTDPDQLKSSLYH